MAANQRRWTNIAGCICILCNLPYLWLLFVPHPHCYSADWYDLALFALAAGFVLALLATLYGAKRWAFALFLPVLSFLAGITVVTRNGIGMCF